MRRPRGRVRYAVGLLIALLLVPLLARGMHHAHDASATRACAVCSVAKHTPNVAPPPPRVHAPILVRTAFAAPRLSGAIIGDHPLHGGRAPPLSSTARTA